MLKANVGLSRKISRDFQSTGYTINIEGEILAGLDDPEAIQARIRELFNLVEAALDTEIDRDQSEQAIGRHDEEPAARQPAANPKAPARPAPPTPRPSAPSQPTNHQPSSTRNDGATPKQIQFIQNLAKRQRLSTVELETTIHNAIGRASALHQLSKKEAGLVIDTLSKTAPNDGNGERH